MREIHMQPTSQSHMWRSCKRRSLQKAGVAGWFLHSAQLFNDPIRSAHMSMVALSPTSWYVYYSKMEFLTQITFSTNIFQCPGNSLFSKLNNQC